MNPWRRRLMGLICLDILGGQLMAALTSGGREAMQLAVVWGFTTGTWLSLLEWNSGRKA